MKTRTLCFVVLLGQALVASATEVTEREELLELRNTITNLIEELVDVGVIDEGKADLMKKTAAAKARLQAQQQVQLEQQQQAAQELADSEAVRVQYVPDHIKQEIRDQVRSELRAEVVGDVMAQAKNERWGVPQALPEWISRIQWKGDVRLRAQADHFSEDTVLDQNGNGLRDFAPNFMALNDQQRNVDTAEFNVDPAEFFDERERSRTRLRERVRLGLDATVTNNLKFAARITTGNINNPVSINQTLGNTGERFDVQMDRAYLRYTDLDADAYPWMQLYGGRMPNPFFSTDLVYDSDLSFQGIAARFSHSLAGSDSLLDISDNSKTLFVTLGAFPIEEVKLDSSDKWLFGGQLGTELVFDNQSSLKLAAAYYNYHNLSGKRNQAHNAGLLGNIDYQANDYTAPQFMQGGNTLFDIRNDFGTFGAVNSALYGLAADFDLVNMTASYDWANLAPIHVILTADIVKNIGYRRSDILQRIVEGGNGTAQVYQGEVLGNPQAELKERTLGYSLMLTAGWPRVSKKGDWQVFGGYKYLQRDAVLDAFADSNFGLGGTNAKGFILGGSYGLTENTALRGRWLTTDAIDGPIEGIDVLQFDLSAKF